MLYVGIDVAKNKHDCCFLDEQQNVIGKGFIVENNSDGLNELFSRILSAEPDLSKVKVGLEATGHYSYNILAFLYNKGLTTFVINPLQTNQFRKTLTLRRTKTDKVDAVTIAKMLMSGIGLKPYTGTSYHIANLKILSRYRFGLVQERAKLKTSVKRLVNIVFPELEDFFDDIHSKTVYELLSKLPSASAIASAHLTRLANLLCSVSNGHLDKQKALSLREVAKKSIGSDMLSHTLELRYTITQIRSLDKTIAAVEDMAREFMKQIGSPITSIPGLGENLAAMIISEIGDFSRFNHPDKILAYAGLTPSTHQSGEFIANHCHLDKHGSRYLRYALVLSARTVCIWEPKFKRYLEKKRQEGKHYNVAITAAAKKLVRLIYAMEKSGQSYCKSK